ncbi:efflux transporter, RND family, MFP subunit [Anaeromyxobacter sp. K]|uniref:efflux RND transporter periplasmic adaptor subunit n=1 Tax=Anaeromyxobacter sp. (strain K) TaxID=447217 RepID=UPI00015F9315|nr:efflux RND transporter periplasmic adaptor subunit [Anaeromyxobacter sp. K]ACG74818.1 efflux transporter, RND family, MFP subunit [Anaeromyxobacter sp. K]
MTQPSPVHPPQDLVEQLGLDARATGRRRWRWIAADAAAVTLVLAVTLALRGRGGAVPWQTEPARRGALTVTVSATGTLEPTNEVEVGSELSGVVRSVEATYNQRIAKGQVLARIDTTKLEAQAAQYRAALAAAEAKVAEARATVEEDRLALERLERVRERSGGKVPAQSDLDAATAALARARATLASAEASVAQSRATLQATLVDMGKAVVRSPVDGVILVRSIEPGQTVAATLEAPVLFTVAEDLRRMELRVDVDEADVGRVKAGQQARFTVDAFPDRTFAARVAQVRLGATTTSGVVTYKAVLAVDNDDLALFPGMTAAAEIVVEHDADALLVPAAALRFEPPRAAAAAAPATGGSFLQRLMPHPPPRAAKEPAAPAGGPRVWVLRGGAPVAVPVTIGSSDGQVTRITGGELAAGAEVVIAAAGGAP